MRKFLNKSRDMRCSHKYSLLVKLEDDLCCAFKILSELHEEIHNGLFNGPKEKILLCRALSAQRRIFKLRCYMYKREYSSLVRECFDVSNVSVYHRSFRKVMRCFKNLIKRNCYVA